MSDAVDFSGRVGLFKQEEGEERLVGGVVLEPGVIDLQGDTVSAAEIKEAAHRFARGLNLWAGADLMHMVDFPPGVSVVESFIAPLDFDFGDQQVSAGSWVMWMHVENDGIWAAIRAGDITGFSIVGTANRVPVPGPVE